MTRWIRLELRILRAYAVVSAGALLVVALAAFGQPAGPQNFGEITVQRINVVQRVADSGARGWKYGTVRTRA